jgi:hypothetical protein
MIWVMVGDSIEERIGQWPNARQHKCLPACLLERVSTLDMLLSYSRYDLGCGVRRLPFGCGNST